MSLMRCFLFLSGECQLYIQVAIQTTLDLKYVIITKIISRQLEPYDEESTQQCLSEESTLLHVFEDAKQI